MQAYFLAMVEKRQNDSEYVKRLAYRFYEEDLMIESMVNQIILGDCLEVMKKLPDKSIDLVLTDPPYGIGYDNAISKQGGQQFGQSAAPKTHYHTSDWDNQIPEKEVFDEIFRVSKNQIIFGGNYFAHLLPATKEYIIWDKLKCGTSFADCELAWTSFDKPMKKIEFMWNGMLQQDMKNKEERIHPTQKPRQLFAKILEKYCDGGIVLDCFSGSGTTALACHDLGLNFICVEKDPEYHKLSVERLEKHKQQLNLFLSQENQQEATL